jgi:hypothetical protein
MSINPPKVHWYVELAAMVAAGGMVRNVFVGLNEADRIATFRRQHDNTDVYMSVARWMQPAREGACMLPFFLDIDADDLEVAREECVRAALLLWDKAGIAPEAVEWRFSGKKGFHGIVPDEIFGTPTTNTDLPIWQSLAHRLVREGVPHLDVQVYQASRVLRLPNSINSKSGLYDVALEFAEIRDLKIKDILEMAKAPRDDESMASEVDCPRAAQWLFKAREWWARNQSRFAQASKHVGAEKDGWRVPPCVRRVEAATLPDGVRHAIYFELARFNASIGMAPEESADRLHEIDDRHPIRDPEYIDRVVHNARKYAGFRGCPNRVLERFCDRERCFLNHEPVTQGKVACPRS